VTALFGFSSQQEPGVAEEKLRSMQAALELPGEIRQQHWVETRGFAALGAISPANMPDPGHFAMDEEAGVLCLIDGIVYADAKSPYAAVVEPDGAKKLLAAYLESGPDCLCEIEGSFSVAWWDQRRRRLTIGTDKIGQNLLFYGQRHGKFVFGSYVAQLMASGFLSNDVDPEGFADLLACEYVLGERTLFRDIRVLGPATYLVIDGDRIRARQYWRIDAVESDRNYDTDYLDELEAAWKLAVKRAVRTDLQSTIGMTGGIDSRMILAAAAAMGLPLFTYTGGLPDSTDVLLARQASDLTGAEHNFRLVEASKADRWLEPMVRYQGGFVATLHTHPCQALYSKPGSDARVQGIGGEYLRGFWAPGANEPVSLIQDKERFLINRVVTHGKRGYLENLWKPDFAELALDAPRAHLLSIINSYDDRNGFLAQAHYFYLHERCRKFLNKGVIISKLARDVYFPFLDHSYVQTVSTLNIEDRLKHNDSIQIELIRRMFRGLLDIPYAKNLIPLSASARHKWIVRKSRSLRARLHKHTGIVGLPPIPVDNHNYARWIREDMRSAILDKLTSPNAAYRAYLDQPTVLSILDQHFEGRADHKTLVAALVTFEIANNLWAG
jgi:asparagine synthase (glutamine-hydrolysing)